MSVAIATVRVTFPMLQSTSSSELRVQSSLGGRRRETRINKAMVASPAFREQWKRERELTTMTQAMDSSSRPLAGFQPTVWGYHFLSYTFQQTEISSQEKHEVEELKERIRKMLVETPDNSTQKLVLIDAIQRLGVAYHFHNEIQKSIQNISDTTSSQVLQQSESDDNVLYVVALRFRLLRQQGHHMSSDVFKQFIDHDGNFKETLINDDVQGLLSLYEAAHMRMHEEEILEEALTFTTSRLESMVPYLSNSLKIQVTEALSRPIRRTLSRVGARKYISIYENSEARNDLLLKFAKLDFNMLQKLHQQELVELTSWWKDLDVPNKIPYTKDRLVEGHFWIIGMCFEPQYSRVRRMLTKLLCLNSIIDDIYDAYGTFDELVLFTNAIQRWDISVVDALPSYMRIIYQELLNFYSEGEQLLSNEGNSNSVAVSYSKNEMKKLVIAYMKETEWMNAGYIPKCEEYMTIALATSTCMLHVTHSLIGMEESVTKETIEWMENRSLAIRAAAIICRLMDDISDHEGQLERKHVASIIDCYIKEYEASKEEAYVEYRKEVTNAWKDINKEFLSPTKLPMFILERALNFARLSDTFFEGGQDGYAIYPKSKTIDLITLLFVESINI